MTPETDPREDLKAAIVGAVPGLLGVLVRTLGAVVLLALCASQVRSCEVERSKSWREARAAQTTACAGSCRGGFTIHFDEGTEAVRCKCESDAGAD